MSKTLRQIALAIGLCMGCGSEAPSALPPSPLPMPDAAPSQTQPIELGPGTAAANTQNGGQSGTETPDGNAVACPAPVPMDERLSYHGLRVAGLLETARRTHTLVGEMDRVLSAEGSLVGTPATLEVDIDWSGPPLHVFGPATLPTGEPLGGVCDHVELPVRIGLRMIPNENPTLARAMSGDGTLHLGAPRYGFEVINTGTIQGGLHSIDQGSMSFRFTHRTEPLASHEIVLEEAKLENGVDSLGSFGRGQVEIPWVEPLTECQELEPEPAGRISFASEEDAFAAVVGRWAICSSEDPEVRGVEIFEDGTWRAILGRGPLELGAGFGREGIAQVVDISEPYGEPGDFVLRVTQSGSVWGLSGGRVQFSASGSGMGGLDYRELARVTRPTVAAAPPAFDRGERAGQSACSSSESDLEAFANDAELQVGLAGTWVGCSGYFGKVRFDAAGMAEFLETPTHEARAEPYAWSGAEGVATTITLGSETWRIVRSARPLKLWVSRGDAMGNWYDPAELVFSAEPDGG